MRVFREGESHINMGQSIGEMQVLLSMLSRKKEFKFSGFSALYL